MTENESYCNCNVECEETSYELSLSISSWPSDQYLVEIFKLSLKNTRHKSALRARMRCVHGVLHIGPFPVSDPMDQSHTLDPVPDPPIS